MWSQGRTTALVALLLSSWPAVALAVGESDGDNFPSWEERVHHELANRARVEPDLEILACGSNCTEPAGCYTVMPPLYYIRNNGRAARFHADNSVLTGSWGHTSSCTVVSNIGSLYPNSCDGAAACACEGGAVGCNPICTSPAGRVSLFGGGYSGEIIASGGSPNSAFYMWLYEPASAGHPCDFSLENGHRYLLLKNSGGVGFGVSGQHVGDFGGGGEQHRIPSGSHWPRQAGSIEAWANWYDSAGPNSAMVNVEGECTAMSLQRGTPLNGAYRANLSGVSSGCHRYFFLFRDSGDQIVTFPETGSLGIGPTSCDDWNSTRPGTGASCNCTPQCAGQACGDDSCGGSCGNCDPGDACEGGQCVCQPQCAGLACGDDSCGGSCGSCDPGTVCQGGQCVPEGTGGAGPGGSGTGAGSVGGSGAGVVGGGATGGGVGNAGGLDAAPDGADGLVGQCSCRLVGGRRGGGQQWLLLGLGALGFITRRRRR